MKNDSAAMVARLRDRCAPSWRDLAEKPDWRGRDLAWFQPQVGSEFKRGLMIVGRCTNSWDSLSDFDDLETWLSSDQSGLNECAEHWFKPNSFDYRFNSSAFWKTAERVFAGISGQTDLIPGWQQRIAWSNLYKVAPKSGAGSSVATVSKRDRKTQRDACLDLLRIEIEVLEPRFVLVMTRWQGWAEDFANVLGVQAPADSSSPYGIQAHGTTSNGASVIVMPHPQGLTDRPTVVQSVIDIGARHMTTPGAG